jgi:bile acid:Na+ symporter, BASS family
MAIAVLSPQCFAPYLLILLGALLFVNLIQLETSALLSTFARAKHIALLSLIKLVVLPLALYASTSVIYPPMALSILLLSGISTGLGAPFVANFVGSKLTLIVGLIIVTSLAVPFVLPPIVHLLYGSHFSIPLIHMMMLLSAALFAPLLGGWFTRKFTPNTASFISQKSLYFSSYSADKHRSIFKNFNLLRISSICYRDGINGIYGTAGYTISSFVTNITHRTKKSMNITNDSDSSSDMKWKRTAAIEGFVAMAYINNILVVVFAEQFFGIETAILPALYNIPYYIGIIILKICF